MLSMNKYYNLFWDFFTNSLIIKFVCCFSGYLLLCSPFITKRASFTKTEAACCVPLRVAQNCVRIIGLCPCNYVSVLTYY